ncbi:MAG: PAAR domain-containing protein [Byssovorax sp.]
MSLKPVGWLGQDASRHDHCYPNHKTIEASPDVLAEGFAVVRVGDAVAQHGGSCSKHPTPHGAKVQAGSASVFVNGKPLAREGDTVKCDTGQTAPLLRGRATVAAGDASPVAGRHRAASSEVEPGQEPDLISGEQGSEFLAGEVGEDRLEPGTSAQIRAYRVDKNGVLREFKLDEEPLSPDRPAPVLRRIEAGAVDQALEENRTPSTGSASDEAGNSRPRDAVMGFDGSTLSGDYIKAMSELGRHLGFGVQARVAPAERANLETQLAGAKNVTLVEVEPGDKNRDITTWTEDDQERKEGVVTVPALLDDPGSIGPFVTADRKRRASLEGIAPLRGIQLGVVNATGSQRSAAAQALATGLPVVQARSYAEGGNTLMGQREDGRPFAIVGYDTQAVTRRNMDSTEGLVDGRQHMGKEAQKLVAADLGVNPKDVIFVEQPAFHIDMAMMPLPGGRGVVVNDSMEAARLQTGWLREEYESKRPPPGAPQSDVDDWAKLGNKYDENIKAIGERASARAPLEGLAARQLEEKGLTVYRVAGSFDDQRNAALQGTRMNFLNSERGIAPDGTRYYIGLAGNPAAEQYFMNQMRAIPSGIESFYFVGTPKDSDETLKMQGGISCRTKLTE